MKKEKILTKQTLSINTMKNVIKFYHLPKFVIFSDSSSSESFVFFFRCFSFSAFCLKYLTRKGKVISSLWKISQLPNKHWNGEKYPHGTNHKYDTQRHANRGHSLLLDFFRQNSHFLCVNAKKINDSWQCGELQPRSQGSLLPVPGWENCYWRRFIWQCGGFTSSSGGPAYSKPKKRGVVGAASGFSLASPPRPLRPTPWSANDITGPYTKKNELVACLRKRLYCIKFETDWF